MEPSKQQPLDHFIKPQLTEVMEAAERVRLRYLIKGQIHTSTILGLLD